MVVHSVLSGFIAGFGYENGVLRIVLKEKQPGKDALKAYDYDGVTPEDAGRFVQELGKAFNYIKGKYPCKPVMDYLYFSDGEW